jgi:predicted RNA polymerase sigma factor
LLRRFGRLDEAADADRRAIELTDNPSERALLEARLAPPVIRALGANSN